MPVKDTRDLMLETVLERDMDLMLLEELIVSEEFQKYIYTLTLGRKTGLDWEIILNVKPRHSVPFLLENEDGFHNQSYEDRETDIEVIFTRVDGKEQILFLENKVDAAFTESQPESYRARVEQAERKGTEAASLLVAPDEYINGKSVKSFFDFTLSYQKLEQYFEAKKEQCEEQSEISKRLGFKMDLISQALNKYKRSGPIRINPGITSFRAVYDRRVLKYAPELRHRPVGQIGTDTWVKYSRGLEENGDGRRYIIHKVNKGKVDLHVNLSSCHGKWEEIQPILEKIKEDEMHLPVPGKRDKSFKISLDVPVLETGRPFTKEEHEDVDRCINSILKLQRWHNEHKEVLLSLEKEYSL